jgi:hypothetical protein
MLSSLAISWDNIQREATMDTHMQDVFWIRSRQMIRPIIVLVFIIILLSLPSHIVFTSAQSDQRCFAETGFCMAGRIREFWENNGGLSVFGFPITPQQQQLIEGNTYHVQTFERYRMEIHPEFARPYDVLLGRLGADRLTQQGRDWSTFPHGSHLSDCRFFSQTGHNVCRDILAIWQTNGLEFDGQPGKSEAESLALFGYPISEPMRETLSDGQNYTVQWFERARFEMHPENAPPYHILLGLLAKETKESLMPISDNGPITPDSAILSPPRATAEQAAAYIIKRGTTYSDDSVKLIVSYYWQVGTQVGVDPLLAIAQNIHETAYLTSWWSQRPRRNPAGLGVTGETSTSPPPDAQRSQWAFDETEQIWKKGLSFADWNVATRAHIGRLLAYALHDDQANDVQRTLIQEALTLRPLPSSLRGVAPTLRGLNGRWAVPGTTYADKITKFATEIRIQ